MAVDLGKCNFCDKPAIVKVNEETGCMEHIDNAMSVIGEYVKAAAIAYQMTERTGYTDVHVVFTSETKAPAT